MSRSKFFSRIILLVSLLSVAGLANGQKLTPEQTGGVYYAYPVKLASRINIPEGMEPFYIFHYGRHGSRWVDSKRRYEWIWKQFKDERNLTPLGKEIRAKLKRVCQNARGNAGALTPLGAQQQRDISRRMTENYPEVFSGDNVELTARSSIVPRCRASMLAFCDELRARIPSLEIDPETKEIFMKDINPETEEHKQLVATTKRLPHISPSRLLKSLFKDPSKISQPTKFLSELHFIASDMQDIPLDIDLFSIFTYEEMISTYEATNERMTICHGESPLNHGLAARNAIPLWNYIVRMAEPYVQSSKKGATLTFGHDTPLFRLLTLLQLSLPGRGMDQIIPMGANLQIIFMRNANDKVYVAFLHNEKQQLLPIDSEIDGIYSWDDVKSYMEKRINSL